MAAASFIAPEQPQADLPPLVTIPENPMAFNIEQEKGRADLGGKYPSGGGLEQSKGSAVPASLQNISPKSNQPKNLSEDAELGLDGPWGGPVQSWTQFSDGIKNGINDRTVQLEGAITTHARLTIVGGHETSTAAAGDLHISTSRKQQREESYQVQDGLPLLEPKLSGAIPQTLGPSQEVQPIRSQVSFKDDRPGGFIIGAPIVTNGATPIPSMAQVTAAKYEPRKRPRLRQRQSYAPPEDPKATKDELLGDYKPHEWAHVSQPIPNKRDFLDDKVRREESKKTKVKAKWFNAGQKVISLNKKLRGEYKHTPLKDGEIRLLLLAPYKVSRDDPLEATVLRRHLYSINVWRKFAALSYHWGNDIPVEEIQLTEDKPDVSSIFPNDKQKRRDSTQGESANGGELWRSITEAAKPKWMKIQKNLVAALKALRLKEDEGPLLIWVDAICIIQAEGTSKSHKGDQYIEMARKEQAEQVTKMAEIYNAAFNVCVWLGEGNSQTRNGMMFIPSLMNLGMLEEYTSNAAHKEKWEGIQEIMTAKWFSRRWVVQEICVARQATVHIGDQVVNWEDFADAIGIFMEHIHAIKRLFGSGCTLENLHDIAGLGANQLVTTISNLSHRTIGGSILKQLVGLEALVCSLLYFETRRPHDAIYSLLTISRDTIQNIFHDVGDGSHLQPRINPNAEFPMKVDYERDPIDLFIEFTRECIKNSGSLDIICRHWAPDVLEERRTEGQIACHSVKLPSWIQKISDSAFGKAQDAIRGRRGGDSLVGCPFRGSRKTYNAANTSVARIKDKFEDNLVSAMDLQMTAEPESFADEYGSPITHILPKIQVRTPSRRSTLSYGPLTLYQRPPIPAAVLDSWDERLEDRVLQVEGIVLAEIKRSSDRITNGNIPAKWLKTAGFNSKDQSVPDKLWRTLVADRGPDGDLPPRWYKRACQHCLNDYKGLMTTTDDLNTQGTTNSEMAQKFLSRVRNVVWNRQFFQAASMWGEEREFFGLMPEKARTSDFICLLKGCTVPVVLQPVRIRSKPDLRCYQLIGEAYVYGAMDGECFPEDVDSLAEPWEWFTLL